jgi:hypothetical protein
MAPTTHLIQDCQPATFPTMNGDLRSVYLVKCALREALLACWIATSLLMTGAGTQVLAGKISQEKPFWIPNNLAIQKASAGTDSTGCPKSNLGKVAGLQVWQFRSSGAVGFLAGMAIDADGAPNAYHPDSRKGLDHLSNAGRPGHWWGLVTDTTQPNGKPIVQGKHDPFPGFYVSKTSLEDRRKPTSDPSRYVDSSSIPYIVLPAKRVRSWKIALGDFAVVKNMANGKTSFAIFADLGPANKLGEGSIALAKALGIPSNPRTGGTSAKIAYIVFPHSGIRAHVSIDEINRRGKKLFTNWGSHSRLRRCFR